MMKSVCRLALALGLGLLAMPASAKGVLLLTFDDADYTGWLRHLPLFAQYDAHATFFPCGPLCAVVLLAAVPARATLDVVERDGALSVTRRAGPGSRVCA